MAATDESIGVESLDDVLAKVMYHKPSKWNKAGIPFLIGRTAMGHTVKGEIMQPKEGERYRFYGEWQNDSRSPGGKVFAFSSHDVAFEDSADGVARYLASYVVGLGPVKSMQVVEHFGTETLHILKTQPERILEVSPKFTPALVDAVKAALCANDKIDPIAFARVAEMFKAHKVAKSVIVQCIRTWGSDAPDVIARNPYVLLSMRRMGWKIVDAIATATIGYALDGIERHVAAIVESLEEVANQGHTYGTRREVESVCFRNLLGCRPTVEAWASAVASGKVIPIAALNIDFSELDMDVEALILDAAETVLDDEARFALPSIYQAEADIAAKLGELSRAAGVLDVEIDTTGLTAGQADAAYLIRQYPVSLIVGAPGTGKTYVITKALKAIAQGGNANIRIVAPTGKAAKRTFELLSHAFPDSEIPCTTIHRALAPVPSGSAPGVPSSDAKLGRGREEFDFGRNAANPIEENFLVIDETSMVDAKLGIAFLRAVQPGTRLVFVGDENQLPSVGAGSVLRDIKAAGLPSVTLTEIQRNSGAIVRACHAIKDGIVPTPCDTLDLENGKNWVHIELDHPSDIADQIVELHRSVKTFDPFWGMQVVSPQKKKDGIGCDELNRRLSDLLNCDPRANATNDDEQQPPFRVGDKVVRTKNGLCDLLTEIQPDSDKPCEFRWDRREWSVEETDIVNGDMGQVLDLVEDAKGYHVVVKFHTPDRLCRLSYGECHLVQAYALTCHKAQGSGFPYVIVPVHKSFHFDPKTGQGLFTREWFYTAISRAEKVLVTVGPFDAIRAAVGRKTVHLRRTMLAERLSEVLGKLQEN